MKKNTFYGLRFQSINKLLLIMKICLILLLVSVASVHANVGYAQDVKLNINLQNATIQELIREIENQSEFIFVFCDNVIDLKQRVSIKANDQPIEKILEQVLDETGNTFSVYDRQIVIGKKIPTSETIPNQNETNTEVEQPKKITGKITDAKNMPIPGVSVVIKGTVTGAIADANGDYTLNFSGEAKTLTFSFVGMKTVEVPVGNKTSFNIVMEEEVVGIEDVVVIGYSTQKKETVTGAIGQISNKELMRSPVTNVSNALVGRIAGMAAVQKTGEAGFEEMTIRIRGAGTYTGDQNPLIVIDGIIRDQTAFNMLDPNDVDGINVLKDASATAVYGVRGANGVIIVSTKRGQKGNVKVSLTSNLGFTTPTTLASLVNSYDYASLRNEAYINDNQPNDSKVFSQDELWKFANNRDYTPAEVAAMSGLTESQKTALLNSPAAYYTSTDYMKGIFGDMKAPQQQYSVNISGGTDKVSYFTSVGYMNQRSLTNDYGFEDAPSNAGSNRNNFRTNFDFKMIRNTEINVSISGQIRNTRVISDRNGDVSMGGRYRDLMLNIFEAPPFSGIGVYGDKMIVDYAGGTIMSSNKGAWGRTPIAYMLQKDQARINQSNLNTSVRVKHDMGYLLKGLSIRGAVSYDHYFTKTLRVDSSLPEYTFTRNPQNPAELLFYGGEKNPKSFTETGWDKNRKFYVEGGVDFNRQFGKHAVTAMGILTAERYTAAGLTYNVPRGFYGVVGRVTYGFDDRYLAEFDMGYNGSENFAPGKQFGFFPAVSAGWVISKEPYFPKNDVVTWLKFRGSYGQTGNSNIGGNRFLYLPGTWDSHSFGLSSGNPLTGYFFGTTNGTVNNPAFPGKYEKTMGNPDVTWEKKESYNIAIEAKFFKDKLSVMADLFKEKRNDILTTLGTTPGIIGLAGSALPPVNVGKMSNRGYELQASWKDMVGDDFYYQVGGQVSYAVNKIDYMAEPAYQYEWMNMTGFSYGQYKALYDEGFYNTPEQVANHPYNAVDANKVQGGDLRIVDINGDGLIDTKDITPTGFSNVPRYSYSGTLSFGYKGFEVSALFTGSAQGTFWMNGYLITPFAQGNGTPLSYMKNRWTPERYASGEDISFPRMAVNQANSQNSENNGFWYRSMNHLKLKNIEVSHTFKNFNSMKRAHISSIRVFVNANNLFTWGGKNLIDGIDPELIQDRFSSEGIIYPLIRVYNFGFNIQF